MPTVSKFGKRERPAKSRLRKLLENVRSQITWFDLFAGLCATSFISVLFLGFRYQAIQDYKPGDVATEDVRAFRDITHEDPGATSKKREAAKAAIPVLYDLNTDLIALRIEQVRSTFLAGGRLLEAKHISSKGVLSRPQTKEIVELLSKSSPFPEGFLSILLRYRFNRSLEAQIIKVLQVVMRSGIVTDRAQFLRDQQKGIALRDVLTSSEQLIPEAYVARDLAGAREYMRQFQLELSDVSTNDQRDLLDLLGAMLVPTLTFNAKETERRREEAAARIPAVESQIKKGQSIVHSGEEITPTIAAQIGALKRLQKPKPLLRQFLGFFLVVGTLVYALSRYFAHYQSRHKEIRSLTLLILLIIAAVLSIMRLLTGLANLLSDQISRVPLFRDPANLYITIPIAFGAVLVTLLVDTHLAILFSLILTVLTGLYYGDVYMSAYVMFGCLAGTYSVKQYRDRAAILKAGLTIGVVNAVGILAIDCLRQAPLTVQLTVPKLLMASVNGILASAMASMLLPALESIFKITTDIRLLELSNLNAPILRRLSVEAPGTYHHSLMVGTLAESAAEAVGANPLLVRVGAYYHDLGKMLKPEYFVENQVFGINKHETLSPNMSSLIIASHVKDGLELAKEIGLAERIRDLIPQHHGTRLMTYFYQKARESADSKNQDVVEADFRYPGPKPQTKEAAIVMMADSVEAASRTLTSPTPAQIQGMINRLVDAIIADNQLDECDITLREVRLVKESFFKILTGIYHRRIDYPGYDFKETDGRTAKPSISDSGSKQATAVRDLSARG